MDEDQVIPPIEKAFKQIEASPAGEPFRKPGELARAAGNNDPAEAVMLMVKAIIMFASTSTDPRGVLISCARALLDNPVAESGK